MRVAKALSNFNKINPSFFHSFLDKYATSISAEVAQIRARRHRSRDQKACASAWSKPSPGNCAWRSLMGAATQAWGGALAPPKARQLRRKSSVNGYSGFTRTGATCMRPGVWPIRTKRVSLRDSASNELIGKVDGLEPPGCCTWCRLSVSRMATSMRCTAMSPNGGKRCIGT